MFAVMVHCNSFGSFSNNGKEAMNMYDVYKDNTGEVIYYQIRSPQNMLRMTSYNLSH